MHDLVQQITTPVLYRKEIQRLATRCNRGRLEALESEGFTLAAAVQRNGELARRIAAAVRAQRYRFGPVTQHRVFLDGKYRFIYRASLTDTLVTGVLARQLRRLAQPLISRSVHSYQPGRSSLTAIAALTRYLDHHHKDRPDPRTRGLYLVRRDVRRFGESIPVGDRSIVWEQLREVFRGGVATKPPAYVWSLIQSAIRPTVITIESEEVCLIAGVPTGSPIQPVICNLYLSPLDQQLEQISGGFYARYGDDLIFAHPDPATTRRAADQIECTLRTLGLKSNEQKREALYLTTPGRPSQRWPEVRHTSGVEYLGCRVTFDGTVQLKSAKSRRLMQDLARRVRLSCRLLGRHCDPALLAQTACQVINRALDPRDELGHSGAQLLRYGVNDRAQLQQLDYLIARLIASAVTGSYGVRGFRQMPYRKLRREYGLRSLVVERNRRRSSSEC